MTASGSVDQGTLVSTLEKNYQNQRSQMYFETVTQIESALETTETELKNTRMNLEKYNIVRELYQKGKKKLIHYLLEKIIQFNH